MAERYEEETARFVARQLKQAWSPHSLAQDEGITLARRFQSEN